MRKRALFLVLSAVLAMAMMPALAYAVEGDLAAGDGSDLVVQDDPPRSGTCGTCNWSVDDNGKLVIEPADGVSGVLPSNDEQLDKFFPWKSALRSIKTVEIRKGVSLEGSASFMFGGSMGGMPITSADLSGFDTSKVTDMKGMFFSCFQLESVNFTGVDTSNVTNMYGMFRSCGSLKSLDLSGFDTSKVTDMGLMFWKCKSLSSLDLSGWDTSNVASMYGMFQECGLESVDVRSFDTSNVTDMECMFCLCTNLKTLDLSSFDTSKVTSMGGMFSGSVSKTSNSPMNLEAVYVSDLWSTASLAKKDDMFNACPKLVGGNGTAYDEAHVDSEYARIDAEGTPGYFTKRAGLPSYAGEAKKAGFTDLAAGEWYLNEGGMFPGTKTLYLDYTIARGLMSGYTGARKGQFGPDDDLSRGMAATIIYRMATGRTADTTNNNVATKFGDVPKGAWYAAAVKWCAENGVVTGYSGTDRFGPEDPITREQLATVIGRYMDPKAEAGDDVSQFKDASSISDYAKGGIAYCCANGIMTGIGDTGNFQPGGKATRCQMSKVIAVTAYELAASGKEPVLDPDPIQTVHYSCSYMEMDMPESWEGNVRPRVHGHTSGAYHVDFYYGDESTYGNTFTFYLFRVDGMEGSGQGACQWADLGDIVWQSKHASGSKAQYKFTDAELEKIIQLMTGGSVTLEQLANAGSESACKAMAKEAVDSFMNNNVVPTVVYK